MDELLNAARENMRPPWDEVREARVLHRVLEAAEEENVAGREEKAWRSVWYRRRAVWWASGSVVAAAAAVALVWSFGWLGNDASPHWQSTDGAPQQVSATAPPAGEATTSVSELTFSPGTRALLDPGAHVTTLSHSADEIELRQTSGRVFYEVDPKREQTFEVLAEHVVVHVVGTAFSVEVSTDFVSVAVRRGVVTVMDDDRTLRLNAGEDLRISLAKVEEEAEAGLEAKEPETPSRKPDPSRVVDGLMRQADEARQRGDLAQAAVALRAVAHQHSSDPRSVGALFSLGRVLRAHGKASESAAAFASVRKRVPGSSLAEDALAEEAVSRAQAGQSGLASDRAKLYLTRHPSGHHAKRMRRLSGNE